MQHDYFRKNIWFDLLTPPPGSCIISAKVLTIALVIVEFKYLTFDPLVGVNGGGAKL